MYFCSYKRDTLPGVLVTIFIQCIFLIFRVHQVGENDEKKTHMPWLIYIVAMFILATVGFGSNTKFVEMTYVDYRNFPGGPNAFTRVYYSSDVGQASFVRYELVNTFTCRHGSSDIDFLKATC